jgi:hypothetical protein
VRSTARHIVVNVGRPINQLNAGLKQFQKELATDAMASKRVEIAIITFGPVRVVQDFITPDRIFTHKGASEPLLEMADHLTWHAQRQHKDQTPGKELMPEFLAMSQYRRSRRSPAHMRA